MECLDAWNGDQTSSYSSGSASSSHPAEHAPGSWYSVPPQGCVSVEAWNYIDSQVFAHGVAGQYAHSGLAQMRAEAEILDYAHAWEASPMCSEASGSSKTLVAAARAAYAQATHTLGPDVWRVFGGQVSGADSFGANHVYHIDPWHPDLDADTSAEDILLPFRHPCLEQTPRQEGGPAAAEIWPYLQSGAKLNFERALRESTDLEGLTVAAELRRRTVPEFANAAEHFSHAAAAGTRSQGSLQRSPNQERAGEELLGARVAELMSQWRSDGDVMAQSSGTALKAERIITLNLETAVPSKPPPPDPPKQPVRFLGEDTSPPPKNLKVKAQTESPKKSLESLRQRIAAAALEGRWKDSCGVVGVIRDGWLFWSHPVDPSEKKSRVHLNGFEVQMQCLDIDMVGRVECDGSSLTWSDGDRWVKD